MSWTVGNVKGVVEVSDGTAVRLLVYTVAEVSVSDQALGFFPVSAGTWPGPAVPARQARERVTWQGGRPDSALRNERSIWGGPGESCSVESGDEPVDLAFIRGLPSAAPGGATTTSTYDPAGNMLTSTDPDGVTATYTYTPLGLQASVSYSGSSAHSVSDAYHADGSRTGMTDATGTSSYSYDPFGELTAAANGAGQLHL